MRKTAFVCLRYFIVPVPYALFQKKLEDTQKMALFSGNFLTNKDYLVKKTEYAIRIKEVEGQAYFGKIARKMDSQFFKKLPADIQEHEEENWPYANFVCVTDTNKQLFILEQNAKVFQKIEQAKNILSIMASRKMFYAGYNVRFEPIVEERAFWSEIDGAQKIYSMMFNLESPNMFGANVAANEALKNLRGIYNNTCISAKIENPAGDLKVTRENSEYLREYADKGGGCWKIRIRRSGRKKTISSSDKAKKVRIAFDRTQLVHQLKKVLKMFNAKI